MNVRSDVDTVDYNMLDTETVDYNPPDQLNQNVWWSKKKKSWNVYTHPHRTMSLNNAAKKVVEKYKKYRAKKFKTSQPTLNEEAQIPPPKVTITWQPPLKHPTKIFREIMKWTVVLPPLSESLPATHPRYELQNRPTKPGRL